MKKRPPKKRWFASRYPEGFKITQKIRPFTHRNRETVVGWINWFILENDMNALMFAERLGYSHTTIRKYTAASIKYTPYMIDHICEVFLIDEEDRKQLHLMSAREWGFRV